MVARIYVGRRIADGDTVDIFLAIPLAGGSSPRVTERVREIWTELREVR